MLLQGEKKKWFDEESDSEAGSGDESGSDASTDEEEEEIRPPTTSVAIQDQTETNLVNLRRTIYLTIMSSMDFEEAGHKLMKIELGPGQEMEIVTMLIECCSQEKTYLRYPPKILFAPHYAVGPRTLEAGAMLRRCMSPWRLQGQPMLASANR